MDYSRATLGMSGCPTPAPVTNAYPTYETSFRLSPIPEAREPVAVHPPAGYCRVLQPPAAYGAQQSYEYEMQLMQIHPLQTVHPVQQPIQAAQATPYVGNAPPEFNLHSSIPGKMIWFNLSLAKVISLAQFFPNY